MSCYCECSVALPHDAAGSVVCSGLQCMIVVFPNLLSQIINPTRPGPAVESLAKGTMGSAPPTRNCYTRHFKR